MHPFPGRLIRKCPWVHDPIKFSLHLQQLHKKAVFFDCSGCFRYNYLETILHAVQHSLIAHIHENLRAQIAALNLVLKSSNMRQIQKSTFSVKLRRISSLRSNHSQPVSKYSPARRTISCHRILMNIGLVGLLNRDN